jgi:hypothetical protein
VGVRRIAFVVLGIIAGGCESPNAPATTARAPVASFRALVLGPRLDDDGIAATVTVRLANGKAPMTDRSVTFFRGSSAASSQPPQMIGGGKTDATGALRIAIPSAAPLLNMAGCVVAPQLPPGSYGEGEVNAATAAISLYLTVTPSDMDCEVRLNQDAIAQSIETQRKARNLAMDQAGAASLRASQPDAGAPPERVDPPREDQVRAAGRGGDATAHAATSEIPAPPPAHDYGHEQNDERRANAPLVRQSPIFGFAERQLLAALPALYPTGIGGTRLDIIRTERTDSAGRRYQLSTIQPIPPPGFGPPWLIKTRSEGGNLRGLIYSAHLENAFAVRVHRKVLGLLGAEIPADTRHRMDLMVQKLELGLVDPGRYQTLVGRGLHATFIRINVDNDGILTLNVSDDQYGDP